MFGRRREKTGKDRALTRDEALDARPVRTPDARLTRADDGGTGGARLLVPLRAPRRFAWLLRFPAGATKTFELDAIGLFVWERCDGKTTVKQIIQQLGARYNLGPRQAEVPTVQFLRTLASKGLIGFDVAQEKKS